MSESGLGHGIIPKDEKYFYNCNYKGCTFEFEADAKDLVNVPETVNDYNEEGEIIGTHEVDNYKEKDEDAAAIIIMAHWETIKYSKTIEDQCCSFHNKISLEVELCIDEEDIQSKFPAVDYTEKDIEGNTKPVLECLGKEIKTLPNGKIMVVK